MKAERPVCRLVRKDDDLNLYKEGDICRDYVKVELIDNVH